MRSLRFCLSLGCLALPAVASAQTAAVPPPPWETAAPPAPTAPPPPRPRVAPAAAQVTDGESDEARALARLRSTLVWFEGNHQSMRLAMGISGIVAGAAGVVTGGLLLDQGRRNDVIYGLGIAGGGLGMILGAALTLVFNDALQPVRDSLTASAASGFTPGQTLAAAEAEWARRAERNRRFRRIGGPISIGLGVALMAGGTALLFTNERGSSTLNHATGTFALVTGAFSVMSGAGIIFSPDPLEQSWEVYRRTRGVGVDLALAPVAGGAMVGVSGTF